MSRRSLFWCGCLIIVCYSLIQPQLVQALKPLQHPPTHSEKVATTTKPPTELCLTPTSAGMSCETIFVNDSLTRWFLIIAALFFLARKFHKHRWADMGPL